MQRQLWGFYGRQQELEALESILRRGRWFFVKITGRRRIGKTSLVQEAMRSLNREKMIYIQIPDSDPAGVIAAARDFYEMFGINDQLPHDLRSLAKSITDLIRSGWVVAIDEFQYFHRKVLFEFNSHMQYEIDRLANDASRITGGLLVLGSIHTEMSALLEDRTAPLFNRTTDQIELPHLDIASVLEILRIHADNSPERLLFLWNLFEGVPKFYRDCYEQDVIGSNRRELLQKMFFSSSSPLRTEADNWFLRELRGRYDLVLKYVARHPGCSNSDLDAYARSVEPEGEKQVAGYISILNERFKMIEKLLPVFSKPKARKNRFYLKDNFLRSWLASLAIPAASVNFKPIDQIIDEADKRLMEAEGHGFERLVWTLYEERSRKGLSDFPLTSRIHGFWDRAGTELDLVALNENDRVIRFGHCKRNPDKLVAGLKAYDGHIGRFLEAFPDYNSWRIDRIALTPIHTAASRTAVQEQGYIPQDLNDLTRGL